MLSQLLVSGWRYGPSCWTQRAGRRNPSSDGNKATLWSKHHSEWVWPSLGSGLCTDQFTSCKAESWVKGTGRDKKCLFTVQNVQTRTARRLKKLSTSRVWSSCFFCLMWKWWQQQQKFVLRVSSVLFFDFSAGNLHFRRNPLHRRRQWVFLLFVCVSCILMKLPAEPASRRLWRVLMQETARIILEGD